MELLLQVFLPGCHPFRLSSFKIWYLIKRASNTIYLDHFFKGTLFLAMRAWKFKKNWHSLAQPYLLPQMCGIRFLRTSFPFKPEILTIQYASQTFHFSLISNNIAELYIFSSW